MNYEEYTAPNGPWTTIDGWNEQGIFTAIKHISDIQRGSKIIGHVGEIGVHHGQLFFALALLTKKTAAFIERSIAIDVFDDQHRNVDNSGHGSLKTFYKNANSVLGFKKDSMRRKACLAISLDSLDMSPLVLAALRDRRSKPSRGFRLFSIDGGHTVVHVLNDLRLAERVMEPGGVVIVDDFMHPKWPGVTEGLHIYCSDRASRLVPFAYGNKKMYLTTFETAEVFFIEFAHRASIGGEPVDIEPVELYGRKLNWVNFN